MYAHIPDHDTIDMIPVYYPRYFRLPGKWFHSMSSYTEYLGLSNIAQEMIKEFKPDIIHAHAATPAGYIGLLLKKKYGLPLICHIRGSDINTYPHYSSLSMHMTKKVLTEADLLVSVSGALKHAANAIAKTKNVIKVVYNGCDHTIFAHRKGPRSIIRHKFGISESDKALIFVGKLSKDKGILELTDAFIRVHIDNPGLHLFIIGNGPETLTLSNIVASCKLRDNIHFIGQLPHDDIANYLSASDILILPSHSEGLPNAVLEAMACSLPVIATRVGGIPEAVEDGKSGILIDVKDVDSLADAINYLIMNNDLAGQMGSYGRRIVESKFTWQRNAEKMIGIYKEATNAR